MVVGCDRRPSIHIWIPNMPDAGSVLWTKRRSEVFRRCPQAESLAEKGLSFFRDLGFSRIGTQISEDHGIVDFGPEIIDEMETIFRYSPSRQIYNYLKSLTPFWPGSEKWAKSVRFFTVDQDTCQQGKKGGFGLCSRGTRPRSRRRHWQGRRGWPK